MEVAAIQMGGVSVSTCSINWDSLDLQPRWRYGGHLGVMVLWVCWSPGCDGHMGTVATWVW